MFFYSISVNYFCNKYRKLFFNMQELVILKFIIIILVNFGVGILKRRFW